MTIAYQMHLDDFVKQETCKTCASWGKIYNEDRYCCFMAPIMRSDDPDATCEDWTERGGEAE